MTEVPQSCPVCQHTGVVRISTGPVVLAGPPIQLIGYRCANGHVFYVKPEAQSASTQF